MSKFYWHPSKADLMGILGQLFRDDLDLEEEKEGGAADRTPRPPSGLTPWTPF